MGSADFVYRVEITADHTLNEYGFDRLIDALADADIEAVIHDAVIEALAKRLPASAWDKSRREEREINWYDLRVVEETP